MSITEAAPSKNLSPYVQLKSNLFDRVLRYTAISEEEFRNFRANTGRSECTVSWGEEGNCSYVVLDDQFLKGLRNICLSLYMDLVNAGEKKLAERIVERNKEEAKQVAEAESN